MIDIGANLTSKSFQRDLPSVIERAAHAGVEEIVVTGTSLAGSRAAADLAQQAVTDVVAQGVVDVLEAVDVHQ